jgi:dTDP-4-amino-4,6-dideoxygalactose transaminase
MIATRDPVVAARARVMRTHGLNRDAFDRFNRVGASWSYDVVAPGFKYNLTDLAAAIGVAQLERVYEFQSRRQAIAELYLEGLADLPLDLPTRAPEGGLADRYFDGAITLPLYPGMREVEAHEVIAVLYEALG